MKKFLKYLLFFIMPIIIIGMLYEILLRNIPNDYLLKKKYLDNHSNKIKILVMGNSHAFYGINPEDFNENCFNAANISQTLDWDFEILKKYSSNWSSLEHILIPISYSSLFTKLDISIESWRVKNYYIYFRIHKSNKLTDYSETFSNKQNINIKKIYTYYILGHSNITCSKLGWGSNFNSKKGKDLIVTGKMAAQRHNTVKNDKYIENVNIIKSIIDFAKIRGVKVIFFTPPCYYTYVKCLNSKRLNFVVNTMSEINREYKNVLYVNLLSNKSFLAEDFYDADHLNELGAKKLTLKIDSLIYNDKLNKL
jgi:hypothetical protein